MYAASVIIAPTAKFGNFSTPNNSVIASAGSVTMMPVTKPLNAVCSIRNATASSLRVAQIQAVQVLHIEHFVRRRRQAHAAVGHHDAGIGNAQRFDRVLLDHEYRHAARVDFFHRRENIGHVFRRQARRRLVEHEHPGLDRQRAREREHLALAAGKIAGERAEFSRQLGKKRKQLVVDDLAVFGAPRRRS